MESKEKKYLSELTLVVSAFLRELDKIMTTNECIERGKRIAKLANWLSFNNDGAMRFGLDYSLNKIKKINS